MSSKWTTDQQNAMNASGGTILVSAAAGSGKTSVLVQRIINLITDPNDPVDIDKFLIVTFTKLAAQEMKIRISKKLSEMIRENPKNKNLQRQQLLIQSASIGTIDSFCLNIIKENFFKLGISPNFRIANESEIEVIKNSAMGTTLEHFYEEKSPDFQELADFFTGEKDDRNLEDIINQMYQFTNSMVFPEIWMKEILKLYDYSEVSIWEKYILDFCKKQISSLKNLLSQAKTCTENFENIKKAYFETLNDDLEKIDKLEKIIFSENIDEIKTYLSDFKFSRLKALKSPEDAQIKEKIVYIRDFIKKSIKKMTEYFFSDKEENRLAAATLKNIFKTLFEVVNYYSREIYSIKISKNLLGFSDLGHLAIKLLCDEKNGKIIPSQIAKDISENYIEVMVDEYQDINDIQNTIFKMVTKNEKNLFMVGDVKQSIYKFRQSRPQIFLEKKDAFSSYNPESEIYPAKISLGKNFRSKKEILDFVNFIFENIMSKETGEIEYNHEEFLIPGINSEENPKNHVELNLINQEESEENSATVEARFIAEKIMEMISTGFEIETSGAKRPATYSDFCILLRNSNNQAHIYAEELLKCGIPAHCEINEKFISTKEITTMISLLKTISNPVQDIALIGVMMSPIFNFSADEIGIIRQEDNDLPFYFSLKKSAEKGNLKAEKFLNQINLYRDISQNLTCDEFINYIYDETFYPEICSVMPNGAQKTANLKLFTEYARKYDANFHKGIIGFLKYLENIQNKESDIPAASLSSEAENNVKILSIHKSKGLEFPVCILADCARQFKNDTDSLLIHKNLGPGTKIKTENDTVKCDNIIRKAISIQNKKESIAEELRILYVALTRAKQKLILISSLKNPQKTVQENFVLSDLLQKNDVNILSGVKSFSDCLLLALGKSSARNKICSALNLGENISESFEENNLNLEVKLIENKKEEDIPTPPDELNEDIKADENLLEKFKKRFNFNYQKSSSEAPLKVAASQLAENFVWKEYIADSKPDFMSKNNISATAKGNAMHKFMCYADFKKFNLFGADAVISNLVSKNFLTMEEAKLLDKKALINFKNSTLFKRIVESEEVLREYRFSIMLPTSQIINGASENENIVVEGALDCAFKEGGKYVIIDYKTDRADDCKSLYEKYKSQLEIYKKAIEEIKDAEVSEIGIFSFSLGQYFNNKNIN